MEKKYIDKVAIVLINYNGINDTLACIESLMKIPSLELHQVILVDNASALDEGTEIKRIYPELTLVKSETNDGFASGNNIGICLALEKKYRYILLLNNDTIVDIELIDELKKYCDDYNVSVPKILYYSDPNKIWYGGGSINTKTGNAKHYNMDRSDVLNLEVNNCTFATGCCLMMCSSIFDKVGLLNENFFMYCEDTEFSIRLIQNGIKINYVPTAKLWHKVSKSTGGSDSPFCTYYITRNRLNYLKEYKNYFKITAYPFSLLSRYVRFLQCTNKNRKKAFMDGIRDHLKGINGKSDLY